MDVSGTGRITFWIKADSGTAPFWFHMESWKPSELPPDHPKYNADLNQRQKSVNVFVDGETVISKDEYGDFIVLRDNHFNGKWQYVSIPLDFLTETDSALVASLVKWSFPWSTSVKNPEPGQNFDPTILRTIKWHTKPESDAVLSQYWNSEGNLWSDTPGDLSTVAPGKWEIDEVVFYPENNVQASPEYVDIYTDDLMEPDHSQDWNGTVTRYGTKSEPATKNIIRWCVNRENDNNFMDINPDAAAEGPYGMALGMGEIPSNNCWLDVRRSDAAEGWDYPLDVSKTGRITFWIKADSGTAPFWFHMESWKPSELPPDHPKYNADLNQRQKSVNVFIDGETIINKDDYGDFIVIRDRHFNGKWQFVSIPMDFLTETDSALVASLVKWSFPWSTSVKNPEQGQNFDPSLLRTIKWHTKPESDAVLSQYWNSEGNLWSDTPGDPSTVAPGKWEIDEVRFQPLDVVKDNPYEIVLYKNDMMDPDHSQDWNGTVTRYGTKSEPATKNIIRWCVNRENDNNFMDISGDAAADGPYGMAFGMGDIPSNNCWLDVRRSDAAEGWDYPMDVSKTSQVTFWIKADSGTAPFWFHMESWKPSELPPNHPKYNADLNQRQKSVNLFIDGETVITKDEYGEYIVMRDKHFNGDWQFVSVPMSLFSETDSAMVADLVKWSFPWSSSVKNPEPDQNFDPSILRTVKWHTKPESDAVKDQYWASPDNLWSDTPGDNSTVSPGKWAVDEVVFTTNLDDLPTAIDDQKQANNMPVDYKLDNAYPNPFNPTTTIQYSIPVSNNVKIEVYNIMGQKVRTLVNQYKTAGTYRVTWDAKDERGVKVSTGMYFYRMQASHFQTVKKVILMK